MLDVPRLCMEATRHSVFRVCGKVKSVTGILISCTLPAAVGDQCDIETDRGLVPAEVIGFREKTAFLVPFEPLQRIQPGMQVTLRRHSMTVPVGDGLLGRILDGLCRPVDGRGPLDGCERQPMHLGAPPALERTRIREPFATGQRAIDGLLTLGRGQRAAIFAGSGVGKSTLLGEIAKHSEAEVRVVALIGERGREVRPFLEDCLGQQGLARSVVVVATSDQTPLMRVRAAQQALAIACAYRERGANVLFLLDSLTRLAMAQRELGLALGEPPSTRGYTPSVFQLLATSIEQLGTSSRGSVTGILTVLVEGDDLDEPIADAVRSLVDGHIVLDRGLAERGHYPAISIGQSISRIAAELTDEAHQSAARKVRAILATYAEAEDLIRIGAYVKGTSPQVDRAIELRPQATTFLRQSIDSFTPFAETQASLQRLAAAWPY